MIKLRLTLLLMSLAIFTFGQNKPAYELYDAKGKKVSYERMMKKLRQADMVFFGELHNNPICHWLQYEVTNDLRQARDLILGAEMFEADNQDALTAYITGEIDAKGLDTLARLWGNYKTDYAPLVEIAKKNYLHFVATNVPRRYANLVFRQGFEALESLTNEEKSWIAPLPIAYDAELPGYKNMLSMMAGHGGENLPKAQAIKDATMAHFILENYKPGALFIHYNGAYHSQNYEGILWYLNQKNDALNYITIHTVLQEDIGKLLDENKNTADFIICVDQDMTTTY